LSTSIEATKVCLFWSLRVTLLWLLYCLEMDWLFHKWKNCLSCFLLLILQQMIVDNNMSLVVWELYNTFQIVVMWDIDFMRICKISKLFNNKDCAMNTNPSYRKSLVHARQIWDSYGRPLPNLDSSLQHSKNCKVKWETPLTLS